jgi:hypothetical protein
MIRRHNGHELDLAVNRAAEELDLPQSGDVARQDAREEDCSDELSS